MNPIDRRGRAFEWPTLLLLVLTYISYTAVLMKSAQLGGGLTVLSLALILTLHSSISHEIIHIIEAKHPIFGRLIIFPAIGLMIPYGRFRDQHLKHHQDENLTDPLDDPESYYLPEEIWVSLPYGLRVILGFNNMLLGRIIVGPFIGQLIFMRDDFKAILRADWACLRSWVAHLISVFLVLIYVNNLSDIAFSTYFLAAYLSLSILKIRSYLEHRAEQQSNNRSVIIEDRGPLALLFLNNNYHAAHHAHPSVPWYRLPQLFDTHRAKFLGQNRDYYYRNYWDVFCKYFLRRKEPVAHPIWRLANRKYDC